MTTVGAARAARRLAGEEGGAGLATLVDGADTWEAVSSAAGVAAEHPPVRAHRVAWKPGRRLRAFYDVPTPVGVRPVAVRWDVAGPGGPPRRVVQAWPFDAAWPHLAEAVDRSVTAPIADLAGGDGQGPIELDVLRYRPGQRHVVRIRSDRTEAYLKIGAAGTVGASAAAAQTLAGAARRAGAVAAEPLWWSDRLGAVAVAAVPGRVPTFAAGLDASGAAHLERLGRFLRDLHGGDVPVGVAAAVGPVAEAALTARAWEHAVCLHPDLGPVLHDTLAAAVAAVGPDPGRPVLLHGDAKLEHLLDTGEGLAVIDLDSVTVGDACRDVGRLLASLWWEELRTGVTGARRIVLAAYDPGGVLDRRALGGWTALALLKQAARRVPVLDRRLAEDLSGWLAVAASATTGDAG